MGPVVLRSEVPNKFPNWLGFDVCIDEVNPPKPLKDEVEPKPPRDAAPPSEPAPPAPLKPWLAEEEFEPNADDKPNTDENGSG